MTPGGLQGQHVTEAEWCKWNEYVFEKRHRRFAFTLLFEPSSSRALARLTLLDIGGVAVGFTTLVGEETENIEVEETKDSLLPHVSDLVERYLSPLMKDKRLKLNASDVEILPGPNAAEYTVAVLLTPVNKTKKQLSGRASSSKDWPAASFRDDPPSL